MKKIIIAMFLLLATASQSLASDSIALGVRAGAATNRSGYLTEAFGDLYLNRLISIGGAIAYQVIDRDDAKAVKRDESLPLTLLAKVHAPLPILSPYAGLGQALIFHDKKSATGSPVMLAGLDFKPTPLPVFINAEYRHQLNGALNIIVGGVGVKF